ncbi:MAG TPA: PKD domain-containing protein [Planctomycetota bacterium]|nr:PKD domain-containing protein [Planctomycetota bacterium]
MRLVAFLACFVLAIAVRVPAADGSGAGPAAPKLIPAFPNYALVIPAEAAARENPILPEDPEIPFSWDQFVVTREGISFLRQIGAFDPGLQPSQVSLLPNSPVNVTVNGFESSTNLISITARPKTGGTLEVLPFKVAARGINSTGTWNLTVDIRNENTRVRGTPFLTRSPGDIIKPGQIVRYTWSFTGRGEKRPKSEAEFVGRTGPATGLRQSTITEVLSIRVQPIVLGHYLLTVTPRDVRGEPPRGSTSNGQVFRCAFGSDNLAPVADGMAADTFTPQVSQTITLSPVVVDPETGTSSFANQNFDFGDGTSALGVSGPVQHAYAAPGIYRVICTVADDQGLTATAEENVIVGATAPEKFKFSALKQIRPEESGIGVAEGDNITATFTGIGAKPGDRIVFVYNRNRFGRLFESDASDTADIILKPGGFQGATKLARNVTVTAGANSITFTASRATLDRTGDPRFGRSDFKGIFKNQRIAIAVIPADGSAPRVSAYTGNVQIKVKGGDANRLNYVPEESLKVTNTTKEPDPRKQEIP